MEERNSLSLSEIFSIIFKRLIWVLGATALCLVVAALVVGLWYNKEKRYYYLSFEISYPGSESGLYPDGTPFNTLELISLDNLKDIKADGFEGVDVERMLSEDDISIAEEVNGGKKTITVTATANYFRDEAQASRFLKAVAERPRVKLLRIIEASDYSLSLKTYDNADGYAEQLDMLAAEKQFIVSKYDKLISLLDATYSVDGKSLNFYRINAEKSFTESDREMLLSEMEVNGYVLDVQRYLSHVSDQLVSLRRQVDNLDREIAAQEEARKNAILVGGSSVSGEAFNEAIKTLISEKIDYEIEIDEIFDTLGVIRGSEIPASERDTFNVATVEPCAQYRLSNDAFRSKITAIKETLENHAAVLKSVSAQIYTVNSSVHYVHNKIKVDGGMSVALAAVVGALLGAVISSLVVVAVDAPKYRKQQSSAKSDEKR